MFNLFRMFKTTTMDRLLNILNISNIRWLLRQLLLDVALQLRKALLPAVHVPGSIVSGDTPQSPRGRPDPAAVGDLIQPASARTWNAASLRFLSRNQAQPRC